MPKHDEKNEKNPKTEPQKGVKTRFGALWIFVFVILVYCILNYFVLDPFIAWLQQLFA